MDVRTHQRIDPELVGAVLEHGEGSAVCELATTDAMCADDRGLVHGGFVFGLADFAAMVAVNDPNVVLGAAETRFLAPVSRGERLVARAEVGASEGRKRTVDVRCAVGERAVFEGTFTCLVLDAHVLDLRRKEDR